MKPSYSIIYYRENVFKEAYLKCWLYHFTFGVSAPPVSKYKVTLYNVTEEEEDQIDYNFHPSRVEPQCRMQELDKARADGKL